MKEVIEKIKEQNPLTKYFTTFILTEWARRIINKEYDDYKNPPENLDTIDIEVGDPGNYSSDDKYDYSNSSAENEYGDIVKVKDTLFIVCNGLVVPKELLEKTILDLIEAEMNKLGISVDDVHQALID